MTYRRARDNRDNAFGFRYKFMNEYQQDRMLHISYISTSDYGKSTHHTNDFEIYLIKYRNVM